MDSPHFQIGDFIPLEEKGTKKNFVNFPPGRSENYCNVTIVDDDEYEPNYESFDVHVASVLDKNFINSQRSYSTVTISPDPNDGKILARYNLLSMSNFL